MKKLLLLLLCVPLIFSCGEDKEVKNTEKIKDSNILTIMLHDYPDDISKEILLNQRLEFENYLYSSDYFLDIKFIDKEISFANLQEDMGEDFSSVLEVNPLPDCYDAHVKAEFVSQDGLKEIEDFINNFKGSDIIQDIFYLNNLPKFN